ncbi:TonB-dependent receptor [Xanthomonas translucens]|uniref:TonB-dependent receptor n=1 Tax=Xanthomonas campestris pv. translucens TaxID=343 RepID=UPI0002A7BB48|nr:TonB-dependent receptor [Xanthomonas translucens]AKK66812.1 TonB-dependent receptor [Xanthomonas translucens pv. undulosa]AVY65676.1 TonB-dependent receptor [Xanthomonas translucens pv. undulosa]ELQ09791.1 TonB-dependent receptor [Xanthomonas translucens DAR61454]MBC3972430.1 TonB-dependent receptor [Xanthomonas translucens pv. undulosa]MCT8270843.1 TonB-dependent receptor [Xanthomonas translucens pv. undulosa]
MSASWSLRTSALAVAVVSAVSFSAAAQQADSTDGVARLDTVKVTAERRSEDSKDVPISASVLRPEYLDAIATSGSDVRVLAGKAPSLNVESSNGRVFPRFYIRGYGNTDFNTYASQPVSLVYDDVVAENAFLKGFPIFDLEGLEVLRGPQGTLFGRNTPAGVVKFNSVKPSIGANDGYASLSYGSYGTMTMETGLSIAMGDTWAARVSALGQRRDDWVDNTVDDRAFEGYTDSAVRVQLLFQPGEDFSALFNAHARHLDGTARLFRANLFQPGSNKLVDGFDPDKVSIDGANTQELQTYGGSANLTWDLGDIVLHSITGYEGIGKYYSRGDIDGGYGALFAPPSGPGVIAFPVETAGGIKNLDQYSQELRAESQYAGPVNWQAGLYYFHDSVEGENYTYNTFGGGTLSSYQLTRQRNTSWAAFGSLNYAATDRLNLRAGIRYTYDKKTFDVLALDRVTLLAPSTGSTDNSKVTGDLSATYTINDAVNVYARAARGFRGASFGVPSATAPLTVAAPETVDAYEIGIKSDLFDKRARISFDIYDFRVKNQQLTAVGGTSNDVRLLNADKSKVRGAEFDFEALLTQNLRVTLGGAYNWTRIEDPTLSVGVCRTCTVTDPLNAAGNAIIDGNVLPQAAKWMGNATLRYGIPVGDDAEFFFYTDWSYRSAITFFLYDSREFVGQPLLEGGAKIGYTWGAGAYEVSVFCRNCTNQIRATGAIDFNNLTGFINDPRIVGAQFRANF